MKPMDLPWRSPCSRALRAFYIRFRKIEKKKILVITLTVLIAFPSFAGNCAGNEVDIQQPVTTMYWHYHSNKETIPPKKKQSSGEIWLTNRCASAKTSAMVIRMYKELQSLTRPYVVAASCMAHSNCDAQLSNTPSCTCRDFKENGTRCLSKGPSINYVTQGRGRGGTLI